MGEEINLNNNYYLKNIKNFDYKNEQVIDINKIKYINILLNKSILLKIDFNKIESRKYKKILKNLFHFKKIISIMHKQIGLIENKKIFLGYVIDYNKDNKEQNEFISGINAIFFKTRYERYDYIYDNVCDYLDSYFYGKNLCDFKDNKCGEKQGTTSLTGCCHHFKHKALGPLSKLVPCEYLKEDHSCGAKCISCKLFTCDYLEKKGIKFKIKDILLLNTFFNPLQKYFIKYMVFTPKEKILKRLLIL